MQEQVNLTVVQHSHTALPATEPETLQDLLGEDLDELVDYKSDTDFMVANRLSLTSLSSEDDSNSAPNPFYK